MNCKVSRRGRAVILGALIAALPCALYARDRGVNQRGTIPESISPVRPAMLSGIQESTNPVRPATSGTILESTNPVRRETGVAAPSLVGKHLGFAWG